MRRVREGAEGRVGVRGGGRMGGGTVGGKEEGGVGQVKGKLRFKVGLFIYD